jgi:Spy/CpxP family protein refolding chaperone
MKKGILFFAIIAVLLMGFTIDSHAVTGGKGRGKGTEMSKKMPGKGPGMCGQCMAMSGERPMMGMGMMTEMIKHLGLDEKQTAEFKALHLKMKKERIQKNADIRIAELELGEILDKDAVDMKAAEAKVRQIESLRSDMKLSHIRTHEEVKAMLTPEQRQKLDSFRGMGMGMGRGMGHGMGMGHPMGKGRGMGKMGDCRMMQMKTMEDDDMPGMEHGDDSDMDHDGDSD